LPKIYIFIDSFNKEYIRKLNKKIAIIYRNYKKKPNLKEITNIKNFCKRTGHKFLISKHVNIAFKLKLDGIYVPSFYKKYDLKKYITQKKFIVVGSAHNLSEIRIKEKQGVEQIFLSPLFKTKKSSKFLEIIKFNYLTKLTNKKIIALGGINHNNIRKLSLFYAKGFGGIKIFKKKPAYKRPVFIKN